MAFDFDVVIVGTGFGGAVCGARLAEAGYRVLLLERGRRWGTKDFPRRAGDQWTWDDAQPVAKHGWFDFKQFPRMTVVSGCGVGGGSLVYANISVSAKPDTFASGWPPGITADTLAPHYERVAKTMNVQKIPVAPVNQWPARTKLLKEAAEKLGYGDRFTPLELAVSFDPTWTYEQDDPHNPAKSKTFVNAQGQTQGTCVHLGDCDIGCEVNARNTLDLNYIPIAEQHGAVVKPLHIVRSITAIDGGYQVGYSEIAGGTLRPGTVTGRLVVLGAGSLGSTELLLRARQAGTLPHLSSRLGLGWSSNGDFLTPAIHAGRKVDPTRGPTITAAVDLLDGAFRGAPIFIEDGGLPAVAEGGLRQLAQQDGVDDRERALISFVRLFAREGLIGSVMPWFAQSRDAADGRLSIRDNKLMLDWNPEASKHTVDAVAAMHKKMAMRTGGMPLTPLTWTLGQELITPHPLGGCNMGRSAADGVVGANGETFGHRNLFVADGAIVPKALGLNPSRTIGALSELIAATIVAEQR